MDAWTGTVDYGDGGGSQPLVLNPDKTFALSHLYAGRDRYTITVAVADVNGGVGTDTVRVGVNLPTTTTLTSSPNVTFYGEAVTFTATVTISDTGLPTGSVTFFDNGTPLGSSNLDRLHHYLAHGWHAQRHHRHLQRRRQFPDQHLEPLHANREPVEHDDQFDFVAEPVGLWTNGDVYGHGRPQRPRRGHAYWLGDLLR